MTKINQLSNKAVWLIGSICIIIFMFVLSVSVTEENCWDKYPNNEVEAILNCEGKE